MTVGSNQNTDKRLLKAATELPLSKVMPYVLTAARRIGDKELEHWVRLELAGYYSDNPAMTETVTVPEYRAVAGRHYDRRRGPIIIQDSRLRFLNTDRLRFGVGTLEELAQKDDMVWVDDTAAMDILREEFDADPSAFAFSPGSVRGVLDAIRTKLIEEIDARRDRFRELDLSLNIGESENALTTPRPSLFRRVGQSVWKIVISVIALLVAGYLTWRFGWK